jgi:hypothetical protein
LHWGLPAWQEMTNTKDQVIEEENPKSSYLILHKKIYSTTTHEV